MEIDQQIKLDIETLLNVTRPKLVAADSGGGSELFNNVSEEFGPIAHRVYLALDVPQRSCERYHHPDTRSVLLDPITVLNRASSLKYDKTIDDPEFWLHGDMIKTLCDYLDLRFTEVASHACA